MNNRTDAPPLKAHHVFWPMPVSVTAPAQTAVEDIIDSYAALSTEPSSSQAAGAQTVSAGLNRKRKNQAERTPSPVPGLQIPDYRRRKAARSAPQMTPPSPSPVSQPVPLPSRMVPPYQVTSAPVVAQVPSALADMPPLAVLPPSEPVYVPLPRHGFIHELPLFLAPHTFTPMFVTPNGMMRYYLFADDDGAAQVALIGRVDQMQALYQDLACGYPGAVPQPFVPPPEH